MNETTPPTFWKTIGILIGFLLLSGVGFFFSPVVGVGILLVGLWTYWKTPRIRNGFLVIIAIPVLLYLISWLILWVNYINNG